MVDVVGVTNGTHKLHYVNYVDIIKENMKSCTFISVLHGHIVALKEQYTKLLPVKRNMVKVYKKYTPLIVRTRKRHSRLERFLITIYSNIMRVEDLS